MMNSVSWGKMKITHKVSLFLLLAFSISYLFYEFLLVPQRIHRDELAAQYRLERQQVQAVEAFALAHPNTDEYLKELDQKITQADMQLPNTPDISRFLLDIEQLSRDCGVQMGYLKPGKITNKEGYREIDVEFSVNGNFIQVMNFLNKAENGSRFINMNSIGMKLGKNTLESKLTAKIYSYGVSAEPEKTDGKAATGASPKK